MTHGNVRRANKTLSLLSSILELALDYERIDRNPARGKKRRLPREHHVRSWVEPEQLMALLDSCAASYRPLAATLAGAGLRIGEAIGLTWADVNLATGSLKVLDAKTPAGIRTVDLSAGLAAELRVHKARSAKTAPSDPVFLNREGSRQTVRNAQAAMKPTIRRANKRLGAVGLDPLGGDVTPHSLRRTYASLRFGAGDDPVYVAEQLGHTEATFSMKVYAKALKRRDRLSGERLKAFDKALDWAAMGSGEPNVPAPVEGIGLPERVET